MQAKRGVDSSILDELSAYLQKLDQAISNSEASTGSELVSVIQKVDRVLKSIKKQN